MKLKPFVPFSQSFLSVAQKVDFFITIIYFFLMHVVLDLMNDTWAGMAKWFQTNPDEFKKSVVTKAEYLTGFYRVLFFLIGGRYEERG